MANICFNEALIIVIYFFNLFFILHTLTCAHGTSELDEALEGEAGYLRGCPDPSLRVKALLVAYPSSCLLPVGLLLLVLH